MIPQLRNDNDAGFAMMAVLGYVMAISILCTSFVSAFHFSLDQQQNHRRMDTCEILVESGIHYGVALLAKDPTFVGSREISIGDHDVDIRIEALNQTNARKITSTAYLGGRKSPLHRAAMEATITNTSSGWSVTRLEAPRSIRLASKDET
jgi:hypothetical protein